MNKSALDKIITFCKRFNYILCYGAGDYGLHMKSFLKMNNIEIAAFFVSDNSNEAQTIENTKILSFANFNLPIEQCGFILSLQEKHHSLIQEKLENLFGKTDGIYAITEEEIAQIKYIIENRKLSAVIKALKVKSDKKEFILYEDRIKKIRNSYTKIEVHFIDMRHIGGAVASWMYYQEKRSREKNQVYYLYYPKKNLGVNALNSCLTNHFIDKGIEVISDLTEIFWGYFFDKYPEMFFIDDEFEIFQYIETLNKKFVDWKNYDNKEYIRFTEPEKMMGQEMLLKIGIHREYICISARDRAYRKNVMNIQDNINDILDIYRNSNIEMYEELATYLNLKEIQSVRMGAVVENQVKSEAIIDYVYQYRSEFMDLYLFSRCKFFISEPSGIQYFAILFSKPWIMINMSVLRTNDYALIANVNQTLMIFQKYWDTKNKCYLSLRDMANIEISGLEKKYSQCIPFNTIMFYHSQRIIPIKNTPEEILEVSQEMMEILNKTIHYSKKEKLLQARYQGIIKEFFGSNTYLKNIRVGSSFLKKNQWLLK